LVGFLDWRFLIYRQNALNPAPAMQNPKAALSHLRDKKLAAVQQIVV
jgi:hypothetical protein